MNLPTPHPAFAAHFSDPIYDAVALETAPFGSDEGSDILWEWGRRRDELSTESSIADVMETDLAELEALVDGLSGIDDLVEVSMLRGAAFTLLRLVGHLSQQDRKMVLRCLDYEIATTEDPSWLPEEARVELLPPLRIQREDLLSWKNPDK